MTFTPAANNRRKRLLVASTYKVGGPDWSHIAASTKGVWSEVINKLPPDRPEDAQKKYQRGFTAKEVAALFKDATAAELEILGDVDLQTVLKKEQEEQDEVKKGNNQLKEAKQKEEHDAYALKILKQEMRTREKEREKRKRKGKEKGKRRVEDRDEAAETEHESAQSETELSSDSSAENNDGILNAEQKQEEKRIRRRANRKKDTEKKKKEKNRIQKKTAS